MATPAGPASLRLYHEVLLLALDDEKGTLSDRSRARVAIAAAADTELLADGRLRLDRSGRRPLVDAVGTSRTGDPVLDACLDKVAAGKRRATLATWISRQSSIRGLENLAAAELVGLGIVRLDERTRLGFIRTTRYPEVDDSPETEIIERLRRAVFSNTGDVDTRTRLLLSLTDATGLLDKQFGAKQVKKRRDRIRRLTDGDAVGKAARQALDEVNAALTVVLTTTTVTTTGAS